MSDRTVVAVGCSTDADYNFLLPLSCLLWREHIGHSPLALLVGAESEWKSSPRLSVALAALDEHQISRHWLGHLWSNSHELSYPNATLAQNSRQLAAANSQIFPDTWVLPADADLWPIRKSFYQAHVGSPHRGVIYYWQGDHFLGKDAFLKAVSEKRRHQTIPTCHVAMRARDWRTVYGICKADEMPNDDVTGHVRRTLDAWFERFLRDDFNTWMSDQDIMTAKLCEQPWFPSGTPPHDSPHAHASGEVLFVPRPGHPPLDRLCRSVLPRWQESFDESKWTDAHVFKNPQTEEHWALLMPIIEKLLPQHAKWAREYRLAYVEAS